MVVQNHIATPPVPAPPLIKSWGEFRKGDYGDGEPHAFGTVRGSVTQVVAPPDSGKSTLGRRAAIEGAIGRSFPPWIMGEVAHKVLYVDGEDTSAALQADIDRMVEELDLSDDERALLDENLAIICEGEFCGQDLSFTEKFHFDKVKEEAQKWGADIVMLDTQSSLCIVDSENDNAEYMKKIARPMKKLARSLKAVVVLFHHPGKMHEEGGRSQHGANIGRGNSSQGAFVRTVWQLCAERLPNGVITTLTCNKIKADMPGVYKFKIESGSRLAKPIEAPPPPPSNMSMMLEFVTCEMKTSEIVAALKSKMSKKTVMNKLKAAVEAGILTQPRTGYYMPKGTEGQADEQ